MDGSFHEIVGTAPRDGSPRNWPISGISGDSGGFASPGGVDGSGRFYEPSSFEPAGALNDPRGKTGVQVSMKIYNEAAIN